MGRLQRYLRRLTVSEWEVLHGEARSRFRGKTLMLLERLRGTGVPQQLSPSEKELAQRLERWIWRRAYLAQQQSYKLTAPPPIEWLLAGAQLYGEKGLVKEALELLRPRGNTNPVEGLRLLLRRFSWEGKEGQLEEAARTARLLQRNLRRLYDSLKLWRLQWHLHRLLRLYGGSYFAEGRKLLERLARHIPPPKAAAPQSQAAMVRNLRLVFLLAQGRPEQALAQADSAEALLSAAGVLNRWLCQLMLRRPLSEIRDTTLIHLTQPLLPAERAILLNRVLLTLLQWASPAVVQPYCLELRRWLQYGRLYSWENSVALGQLLWLSGDRASAAAYLESIPPAAGPFLTLQTQLLKLLLYIDNHSWKNVAQQTRKLLQLLRKLKSQIASAPALSKLVRHLYAARVSSRRLLRAAALWKSHLRATPAEGYFWGLTLLPDWVEAQLNRQSLLAYRSGRAEAAAAIESFMAQVRVLLG